MFDNTEVFENSLRGFVECLGGELHTLMLAPSGFFTIFDRGIAGTIFQKTKRPLLRGKRHLSNHYVHYIAMTLAR